MPFSLHASTQVSADAIAAFIAAPIGDELLDVPGIGPANKAKLVKAGYTNPTVLIGVFLSLKNDGVTVSKHMDAFYDLLSEAGVTHYRSSIVRAIAEKCNLFIPGIYDESSLME